jgi:hypothetical protein
VTIVSAPEPATTAIEPCPTFRHDRFADNGLCSACGWTADEHDLYVELAWGSDLPEHRNSLPQALRRPRGFLTAGV